MEAMYFKYIFNYSPLPIYIFQDSTFRMANPKMVEITGYSEEELLGANFADLIHPGDRQMVADNAVRRLAGEKVTEIYAFRAITKQGEIVYIRGFYTLIEFEGRPAILGQLMDITAQIKIENEQREAKKVIDEERAFVSAILDTVGAMVAVFDREGRIVRFNRACENLTGYTSGELADMYLWDLLVDSEEEKVVRSSFEWLWAGMFPSSFENYWLTRSGERRLIAWSNTAMLNADGTVKYVIGTGIDITEKKQAERKLILEKERLFVTLASIGDAVIAVNTDGIVTLINTVAEALTGWHNKAALGRPLEDVFYIINEVTCEPVENPVQKVLTDGKIVGLANHTALICRDGSIRSIADSAAPIRDAGGEIQGVVLVFRDVTEEKRRGDALKASEARLRLITDNMRDMISQIDARGVLIYASPSMKNVLGYEPEDLVGKYFFELVHPEDMDNVSDVFRTAVRTYSAVRTEYRCKHAGGSYLWLETMGNPVFLDEEFTGLILGSRDITQRKAMEDKMTHLSYHDSLTGLFNRACFEQEMRRLEREQNTPVSIIVCDVDGLKLINDSMGHDHGDAMLVTAAAAIKGALREGDMVARIGGDEFAVLLPKIDLVAVEQARNRILSAVCTYNADNTELPLSISVGFATSYGEYSSLAELFKEADNNMYREKLHRSQSARSAIVQTLMKALEARDFITEGHAERLQELVAGMAAACAMSTRNISDLKLFAQFHDIGKVGIPDRILNKPGPLNQEEFNEMKRHCEIGHRIAQSSPDLVVLADLILKHHEWWNGQGYPLGLSGDNIPLECRILSIADAYDAMTSDRPYRKAMTHREAVYELMRCSGTQFDPYLLLVFLDTLEDMVV